MPGIIEYTLVQQQMAAMKYRSLYHNSGAFGFDPAVATVSRGWVGPPDESIRESARSLVRQAPKSFAEWMSAAVIDLRQRRMSGRAWLTPRSHWAYELEFGHRDWLPGVLREVGIDPTLLRPMNNGSAIEFGDDESAGLRFFIAELLRRLVSSDFQLTFIDYPAICTIHTRCQLWWTTTDASLMEELDLLLPADADTDH